MTEDVGDRVGVNVLSDVGDTQLDRVNLKQVSVSRPALRDRDDESVLSNLEGERLTQTNLPSLPFSSAPAALNSMAWILCSPPGKLTGSAAPAPLALSQTYA